MDEHSPAGGYDIYFSKFDSEGNFQWVRTWGTNNLDWWGYDECKDIKVDKIANMVYITGYFRNTCDLDPSQEVDEHTADGSDIFISKFNINGDFQWAKTFYGGKEIREDVGYALALDSSGNVYITGQFGGTVDFDPGPEIYNLTPYGTYNADAFLCKLTVDGEFVWANNWCGDGDETGRGLIVSEQNDIYVTGSFNTDWKPDFDPGPNIDEQYPYSGTDVFLSKFDINGNFQWAKIWGGNDWYEDAWDRGEAVIVDILGDVYVTGCICREADLDPGPGEDKHNVNKYRDSFLSKFNGSGEFLWARSWGGFNEDFTSKDSDIGRNMAIDKYNNVYVCGEFFGTDVDFDPGAGYDNHSVHGPYVWYNDIFFMKYLPNGYW